MSRGPMILAAGLLLWGSTALAQSIINWTEWPGRLSLGYPVPTPVDTPLPFDGFRSHAGLHTRHQDLRMTSSVVDGEPVGQTRLGREIWAYRLSRPGDHTPEGLERAAVMFAGTMHAREWQSPEVVTGLMELLADRHDDGHWLDYIADHVNIVVVPVINVDGFLQTQRYPRSNWLDVDNRRPDTSPRDGRMRRKNHRNADEDVYTAGDRLNGVDLNRNNPPFWPGPEFTEVPEDLTYRGPASQSEPEITALLAAADLAPSNRLRFYADMHSYTKVFFSVRTGNSRLNTIQRRVLDMISDHHAALPGNKVYEDRPSPINTGIGTTSEYFAHIHKVPALTWEIEPGEKGGSDYGGFGTNGHDGFILPESEIRRVRENLAQSMAASAYHMAGPPHIVRAEIFDEVSGALVWSMRWSRPETGQRRQITRSVQALEPGRDYRLWIAFSKPMRWRDGGAIVAFPGQSQSLLDVDIGLEAGGETLEIERGALTWNDQPGPAPDGYHRYRDDALATTFRIAQTSANTDRIELALGNDEPIILAVNARDLTSQRLDANPASPVDFQGGVWTGYDSHLSNSPDSGGIDRTLSVPAVPEPDAEPPPLESGHSAMWFDPARSGEGWMIEILDPDRALGYWFTFDENGNQRWLIGSGDILGNRIHFPELQLTSGGQFGPDFDPGDVELERAGTATLVFAGCDNGWFEYQAFDQQQTLDLARLSEVLGLDCPGDAAEVPDHARQSGSWYGPARAGEGFTLQWLDNEQVLVLWFTYDTEGNQTWMIGLGEPDGERIVVPELLAPRGARFGEPFDPDDVELVAWGRLELTLGCREGSADYESELPEFGAGSLDLVRLTFLADLDCET